MTNGSTIKFLKHALLGCLAGLCLLFGPLALAQNFNGTVTAGKYNTNSVTGSYQIAGDNAILFPSGDITSIGVGPDALSVLATSPAYNIAVGPYALYSDSTGIKNVAIGYSALSSNTSGSNNFAVGLNALTSNTTGSLQVAVGSAALAGNSGADNTAIGFGAIGGIGNGTQNVGIGQSAMAKSTSSNGAVAIGATALYACTDGCSYSTAIGFSALNASNAVRNVAIGAYALGSLTSGIDNVVVGTESALQLTGGIDNVVLGIGSLTNDLTGDYNVAIGDLVLVSATGNDNTSVGHGSGVAITTGTNNTLFGFQAGNNVTTGSNNIEIGTAGTAADNNTIQIGVQGTQTQTTVAGIYGTIVTGSAVYVTSTGQLGMLGSSERFKTDIAPMPALSAKLSQLRPVIFHYKTDPKRIQQYGLIAEEVDKVYPELVIRDDHGKIQGVRYEELAPMLLNEIQKQHQIIAAQATEIRDLKQQQKQFATHSEISDLKQQLQAALAALHAKDQLVAQR